MLADLAAGQMRDSRMPDGRALKGADQLETGTMGK
jgi:hypothetical protein